jgi:formamidopyrimidine-DNA glycosylase
MDRVSAEVIKPFDGSGDVATWLKKVKLVARIKKIKDTAALIPLYLEGAAFAVYDQISDAEKDCADDVEKALLNAFGQNKFAAYDVFRQRSWCPGEAVDVFLADLRRLAGLADIEDDELIRCAFVCGLPPDVSSTLRAASRIRTASIQTIVEQARVLMDERVQGAMAAVRSSARRTDEDATPQRRIQCYECGGGHPARYCKRKKPVTCWNCDKAGHLARNCPVRQRDSGNDVGKSSAPTVSPQE